ncbi:hypothetical protein MKX03_032559 [Papaver bracteatum]|nr:hypothetical protein MKX03_032559 [Papaver bracteatum]
MSFDLNLKPSCGGSNFAKCSDSGTQITRLIRDSKASAKEGSASASKGNNAIPLGSSTSLSAKAPPAHPSTGPLTEKEVRDFLLESAPITTEGLVAEFWGRLKSEEDKNALAAILRRIAKKLKFNGANYVVLRGAPADPSTGPVAEEEIRAVLSERAPLTAQGLVLEFWERLKSKENRNAFAAIVKRISKIQMIDEAKYVVLRDYNAIPSGGSTFSSAKTLEEIRAVLVQSAPLTTRELVEKFIRSRRLNSKEDKDAFVAILTRIAKTQKFDGANYVVLKDQ